MATNIHYEHIYACIEDIKDNADKLQAGISCDNTDGNIASAQDEALWFVNNSADEISVVPAYKTINKFTGCASYKNVEFGAAYFNANMFTSEKLIHIDDENTFIGFCQDQFRLVTGSYCMIHADGCSTDKSLSINPQSCDIDTNIYGDCSAYPALFVNAGNNRVGINCDTPTVDLEVDGDLKVTGSIVSSGSDLANLTLEGADPYFAVNDTSCCSACTDFCLNVVETSATAGYFSMCHRTTGALTERLYADSTDVRITAGDTIQLCGNVGICCSSPAYELDVVGDARLSSTLYVGVISCTGDINITPTSKVGICCSSPANKLEVYGDDANIVAKSIDSDEGTYIGMFKGGGSLPGSPTNYHPTIKSDGQIHFAPSEKFTGYWYGNLDGVSGRGALGVVNSESSSVTKVFLNSNGSSYLNGGCVGIGCTSPAYELDVVGDIQVTSEDYKISPYSCGCFYGLDFCAATGLNAYATRVRVTGSETKFYIGACGSETLAATVGDEFHFYTQPYFRDYSASCAPVTAPSPALSNQVGWLPVYICGSQRYIPFWG